MNPQIDIEIDKFFKINLNLSKNQILTLFYDDESDLFLVDSLFNKALKKGAAVNKYKINNYQILNLDKKMRSIVDESNIMLGLTTKSLFHTKIINDACKEGKYFFAMTGATINIFDNGGATADFVKIAPKANKLKEIFDSAKNIKISTKAGTNFIADITGRMANAETGLLKEKFPATFPDIEVNTSILEEEGEGVIVIDGSIGNIGIINEPITLSVKNGKVVKIEGGEQAKHFESILNNYNSNRIFQIAEIGIGLNDKSNIIGNIIEDEATLGTAHIGLGNNKFMGGNNEAPGHIDLVFREPEIFVDNKLIISGKTHFF